MRNICFCFLVSFILASCSSEETAYSYLSRTDAVAEIIDLKLNVTDNNAKFFYLVQANEMYAIWGNESKDSEYILKNKNLIDEVKPITNIYPQSGDFNVKIKTLGLKRLDLSKINDTIIAANEYNSVSELKLTDCKNIKDLRFANQPIASVDLSGCTTLVTLYCGYPEGVQTIIGLEKLEKLEDVLINGSLGISDINFTSSDSLKNVSVSNTDAKEIRLEGLEKLKYIELKNNQLLDAVALNTLFEALPKVSGGLYIIVLSGNKGDNGCDKLIATAKGWSFK